MIGSSGRAILLVATLCAGTGLTSGAAAGTAYVDYTGFTQGQDVNGWSYCEGHPDTHMNAPYRQSSLADLSTVLMQTCKLNDWTSSWYNVRATENPPAVPTADAFAAEAVDVDMADGSFHSGKTTQQQISTVFTQGGTEYVFNWGITRMPALSAGTVVGTVVIPALIHHTAYGYITPVKSRWMGDLIDSGYGSMKFADLVLPGAHDAGMYVSGDPAAAVTDLTQLCLNKLNGSPKIQVLCGLAQGGGQLLDNTSLTQKDTFAMQLKSGVRYFDVRPGWRVGTTPPGKQTPVGAHVRHIHNFVPGGQLVEMLADIQSFLSANPREIVVLKVQSNGLDDTLYTFLDRDDLTSMLDGMFGKGIGYRYVQDFRAINQQTLSQLAGSGQRVIVQYGDILKPKPNQTEPDINDSYGDGAAYQTSLSDPLPLLGAVRKALAACPNADDQYTVLQLQNTAPGALVNYAAAISSDAVDWLNSLGESPYANILQGTKPWFDVATYSWSITQEALDGFAACDTPVVLLNDFADAALTAHAVAISKYRHDH